MKSGDQKQLSSVCTQANVAQEAQELQIYMWPEMNDIIKSEPQQNNWHCWSSAIDIQRLSKKSGQETKAVSVCAKEEEVGTGIAYRIS